MSIGIVGRSGIAALVVAALLFGLSACGSSGSSSTDSTVAAEAGGQTEGGGAEADGATSLAAARKTIAPYIGKPGAFPVTEKLKEVPKGATIAYMDCGTPVCALFWELLQPAGKAMGVKLTRVKAGDSASTVSAAFDSVVAEKPDAVIVTAISVELWKNQLKELQEANIPVVTTGITGTEPYGIEAPQAAEPMVKLWGKLMADYVATEFGTDSNVVFYVTPELPFTTVTEEAFGKELESVCPECRMRSDNIAVATIGNTAPSTVVSDLQANPETTVAVFGTDEAETGLPAALQSAGIEVKTMGAAPSPANLQYLKEGKEAAALGYDLPVASWELVDQAAREIAGQPLSGPAGEGITDVQFLTRKDIKFDPSKGWTGYPEFAEMFAELWGVKG